MMGDILSEALLAAVTLGLAARDIKTRPAIGIGLGLIGLAAILGALNYYGMTAATGPHRFVSLLAACAGFPLLVCGVHWPQDAIARRPAAAARFGLVIGAVGVVLVVMLNFAQWSHIVPAVSALLIAVAALHSRKPLTIAGSLLLLVCFILSLAAVTVAPFDADQQFHVLMALSLGLLAWRQN
ncbi:MAG: hypothetical protein JO269_06190 [Burkholderiaceae bacterium]|nr:hypothetical protein [Burkholderiaceae bacterium]